MSYYTYKRNNIFFGLFVGTLHLVSALPANVDDFPSNVNISSMVIDPWLSKRISVGDIKSPYINQVPDCGNTDPSYASTPITATDGSGTKMQNDDCSGGRGGKHCWQEIPRCLETPGLILEFIGHLIFSPILSC